MNNGVNYRKRKKSKDYLVKLFSDVSSGFLINTSTIILAEQSSDDLSGNGFATA